METIMLAVLFSVPGIVVNKITHRVFPKSIKIESDYEKTISAILYSTVILFFNLLILKNIFKNDAITFKDLLDKLNYTSFFMKYILLTICTCILFSIIKKYIVDIIILKAINIFKKNSAYSPETTYSTVWDGIFENSKVNLSDTYITVEKDGVLISQGLLKSYSAPSISNRELLLSHTVGFNNYLENDKTLDPEKRLLDVIQEEYYNLNTGVLIKFYDNTKLVKYLNEP